MMQQSLCQLDSPLHSTRESFDEFFGSIRQAHPRQDLLNSRFQWPAAKAVKMSLMPEVFVSGELQINALRLKDYADLPPQTRRILRGIAPHDGGTSRRSEPSTWKESGKALSCRFRSAQQAEQFRRTHVERNAIERRAVLVAMYQIFDGNHGLAGGEFSSGCGDGDCGDFRCQRVPE